jgi:hypothetical protein
LERVFDRDGKPVKVEHLVCYGLDDFEKIGDPGYGDITFNAAAFVDALVDVRAPPCVQFCNESENPREWVNDITPDNWRNFWTRNECARLPNSSREGGYAVRRLSRQCSPSRSLHATSIGARASRRVR